MKNKETLEEDLKFPIIIENGMDYLNLTTKIFNNGAKWQQENSNINALDFEIDALKREIKVLKHQQERSYSEEEVKKLAFDFYYEMSKKMNVPENLITENMTNLDVWFKQFKKK